MTKKKAIELNEYDMRMFEKIRNCIIYDDEKRYGTKKKKLPGSPFGNLGEMMRAIANLADSEESK